MVDDVELLYRQHLTESDRRVLTSVAVDAPTLSRALSDPRVEAAVFTSERPEGALVATSPFLTFAVAVHRTAARLETTTYVEEHTGPRQRIPVFDVGALRDLLGAPARRFFIVELLASYTHISSGSTWERTRRGWRRRRFSELDPVRLAGLLEVVDPSERPGVYRRLGDVALFLTGVFPDHPSAFDFGGSAADRLLRLTGTRAERDGAELGGRPLLEHLGSRWYQLAVTSAKANGSPTTSALAVVGEMSERFDDARRVLNVVTDRYLYPLRDRWLGAG